MISCACIHKTGQCCEDSGGVALTTTITGQPLGTPAIGVSPDAAAADHVHPGRSTMMSGNADNLAANTTTGCNFVLNNASHRDMPIMRACKLSGISAALLGAAAGSALLVRVRKNGGASDTTLTLTIAIGATTGAIQGTGVTFAAGDTIGINAVTDASWTGTTVDISAVIELTDI